MKNTRTGQRTIRKLLKGAGSAILLATLFVLVFAGTLSGAFGIEENLQQNGIIESNVADASYTKSSDGSVDYGTDNATDFGTYYVWDSMQVAHVGGADVYSSCNFTFNTGIVKNLLDSGWCQMQLRYTVSNMYGKHGGVLQYYVKSNNSSGTTLKTCTEDGKEQTYTSGWFDVSSSNFYFYCKFYGRSGDKTVIDNIGFDIKLKDNLVFSGSGTSASPFLLKNRADFDLFAYFIQTGNTYENQYFKVQPDNTNSQASTYINMSGNNYIAGGVYEYGGGAQKGVFKGKLDGDNKEIRNLVIKNGLNTARAGLFGTLGNGAEISNVIIDSKSSISSISRNDAASIAGFIEDYATVSITNCVNYASITAPAQVGGFVANTTTNSTVNISGCKNYGTLNGGGEVGGIVGYARGTVTISGCSNESSATINGGGNTGGIIGYTSGKTTIKDSQNKASVGDGTGAKVTSNAIVQWDCYPSSSDENWTKINDNNVATKFCSTGQGSMSFIIRVDDASKFLTGFAITNGNDTESQTDRLPTKVEIWGSDTNTYNTSYSGKSNAGNSPSGWTTIGTYTLNMPTTNYYRKAVRFGNGVSVNFNFIWVRVTGSGKIQFSEFEILRSENAGGIVGYADGTSSSDNVVVDSSTNSGNVTGGDNVGGIVGGGIFASLTTSATNSGKITGISAVGGIAGCAGSRSNSSQGFSITNPKNTGDIVSTGGKYVGGISGYSRDTSYIGTTLNEGIVSAANSKRVGGVVGFLYGGTLKGAVNIGDVQGFENVGGIVGVADWGTINGATNSGNVSVSTDTDDEHNNVGGIVGWIANANAYIIGSLVNTGNVSGDNNIGGIVGYNTGNIGYDSENKINAEFIVKNQTISGKESVGGIVGYNDTNGKIGISSFDNSGTEVKGSQYIGGVLGYCIGELSITTSTDDALAPINNATVKATSNFAGGFIGYTKKSGLTLANLTNSVTISGSQSDSNYIGGIIGGLAATTTLKNCVNSGAVSGTGFVGGIVGGIDANTAADLTITNSHNSGEITSTSNNVGGILGGMGVQANILTITGSYNTGAITCKGEGGNVGGIVGRIYTTRTYEPEETEKSVHIANCYNLGSVIEKKGDTCLGDSVGGIVGYLYAADTNRALVEYCYNYAHIEGNQLVGGIIGSGASGSSLTINYCYVVIVKDTANTANSKDILSNSTCGAIIGGSYAGDNANDFNVVNSWGFLALGADNPKFNNLGKVLFTDLTVTPQFKENNVWKDVAWTDILTKNINRFKVTGTTEAGKYASSIWGDSAKSSAGYVYTNVATPSSIEVNSTANGTGGAAQTDVAIVFTFYYDASAFEGKVGLRVEVKNIDPTAKQTKEYNSQKQVITNPKIPQITADGYGIIVVYFDNAAHTQNPTTDGKTKAGTYYYIADITLGGKVVGRYLAMFEITPYDFANKTFNEDYWFGANDSVIVTNQKATSIKDDNDNVVAALFLLNSNASERPQALIYQGADGYKQGNFVLYIKYTIIDKDGNASTVILTCNEFDVTEFVEALNEGEHVREATEISIQGKDGNVQGTITRYYTLLDSDFGWRNNTTTARSWGTKDNPYVISSQAQLLRLSQIINGAKAWNSIDSGDSAQNESLVLAADSRTVATDRTYANAHFVVTANILLDSTFKPIGNSGVVFKAACFASDTEGTCVEISYCYNNHETDYVGLFGKVEGTYFKDLHVVGASYNDDGVTESAQIVGNDYVGGLVGKMIGGTIDNCTFSCGFTPSVVGHDNVGGLIGYAEGTTVLYDTTNDKMDSSDNLVNARVQGHDYVGGIVGKWVITKAAQFNNSGKLDDNGKELGKDLYFSTTGNVEVTSSGSYAGAIAGKLDASQCADVFNLNARLYYNSIDAKPYEKAQVIGVNYVGALYGSFIGNGTDKTTLTYADDYLHATVKFGKQDDEGNSEGSVIGGIIGYLQDATLAFANNYTVGGNAVKIEADSGVTKLQPSFFGGIIGVLGEGANIANGAAINDGNRGAVTLANELTFGTSTAPFGDFVGGIIGYVSSGAGKDNNGSTIFGGDLKFVNNGKIYANNYVGGIIGAIGIIDGYKNGDTLIFNNIRYGSTTATPNANIVTFKPSSAQNIATVYGADYVGGLVGGVFKKALLYLENKPVNGPEDSEGKLTFAIYNKAIVSGDMYVGGIVGYLEQESHVLNRIVNIGTGNTTDSNAVYVGKDGASYVGGLVGRMIGGTISNSVSASESTPNSESDLYRGSKNVGGLVGYMQGGTLENSISTGFKFDGNTDITKGGVAGGVLSPIIEGSWTIYIATYSNVESDTNYAYRVVSNNKNGKYVLVDKNVADKGEVGTFAHVLAMAGICNATTYGDYTFKQGELQIGATYSTIGDKNQLAFYDASGSDAVMDTVLSRFESKSAVVYMGVPMYDGTSFSVCKTKVVFKDIARFLESEIEINPEDIANARKIYNLDSSMSDEAVKTYLLLQMSLANVAKGYQAPSGAKYSEDSNLKYAYYADVVAGGTRYDSNGYITNIKANIYFKGVIIGTSEADVNANGQVGDYDSGNLKLGSEQNPYTISTQNEWNEFAWSIYSGTNTYTNAHIKLLTDVTVTKSASHTGINNATYTFGSLTTNTEKGAYASDNVGYNFAGSIANSNTGGKSFQGNFDGNGKKITITYNSGNYHNISVFPNAKGASFKNLTIEGSIVAGSAESETEVDLGDDKLKLEYNAASDIAGFVGKPLGSIRFENCTNHTDIIGYSRVAGFAGFSTSAAPVTFIGCVNKGNIESLEGSIWTKQVILMQKIGYPNDYQYGTGGLIAYAENDITIESCLNTGKIKGKTKVGGLVGRVTAVTTINNSANTGYIEATEYNLYVDSKREKPGNAWSRVGGIVGEAGKESTLKMFACYNTGHIRGWSNIAGGLVGIIGTIPNKKKTTSAQADHMATIAYCYNTGTIEIGNIPEQGMIMIGSSGYNFNGTCGGGLVGVAVQLTMRYCYNTGNVYGYGGVGAWTAWQVRDGGILAEAATESGVTHEVKIENCYSVGKIRIMEAKADKASSETHYSADIVGFVDEDNIDKAKVTVNNCYGIANNIINKKDNKDAYYSGWNNQKGGSIEKVRTGTTLPSLASLTAVMKKNDSTLSPTVGTIATLATTWSANKATIGANSTTDSNNSGYLSGTLEGYIYLPGCLPQLAVFAVDTYNGLSMNSQNYGYDDNYGSYRTQDAGDKYSPYVIRDGIDLLGLQALVDLGYTFSGKYVEFADGTNNITLDENMASDTALIINLPTDGSTSRPSATAAYKFSSKSDADISVEEDWKTGKSYHLFALGGVLKQDNTSTNTYNAWKASNHAYGTNGTLAANAAFDTQNFLPIGRKGGNNVFKGTISGEWSVKDQDGKVVEKGVTEIANLRIAYKGYAGLFGNVQDAKVRSIGASGEVRAYASSASGYSIAGGIVAAAYGSSIIDGCEAGSGNRTLEVYAYGTSQTYSDSDIAKITTAAGGIVGRANTAKNATYYDGTTLTVKNNKVVNATVQSAKDNIGGVIGYVYATYSAKNRNNRVEIASNLVQEATISAIPFDTALTDVGTKTGGIIGYSDEYISIIVRECVVGDDSAANKVNILGENRIGGIVGETPDAVNEISGCKVLQSATIKRGNSWGDVSNADEGGTAIGGIVGLTFNAEGTDPITTTFSGNIVFKGKIVIDVQTKYNSVNDRSNDGVVRNVGGIVGDMGSGARIATGSTIEVGGTIEIAAAVDTDHFNRNIGGVAGRTDDVAFSGTFKVAPTITAKTAYQIGGFIGKNNGIVNILADDTDIQIGGNITASHDVGGFIGYNNSKSTLLIGADQYRAVNYDDALSIRIVNSVNDAEKKATIDTLIKGTGDNVGGIVGNSAEGGVVKIVKGVIVNAGQVAGNSNIGGIIGYSDGALSTGGSNYGSAILEITNEGKVVGEGDFVGGVIGRLNSGRIAGRFVNKGNVKGRDYVGGSIGYVAKGASIESLDGKTEFINEAVAVATQSDALVAADNAVADDSKFNVVGINYVGGSIGMLLGQSLGNEQFKVEFRSKGTVNGEKYVGGSIGVLAGKTGYTDFISEGAMLNVGATTAVGGSVGFIGVPNSLVISKNEKERITSANIDVSHTHFEANGILQLLKATEKPSADKEYVWGGIGGAIGAIGNKDDNLFDNTNSDKWTNNTYYARGTVTAEGYYHVGGIVGLIKADNITIANMLAYGTTVVGGKNVGGIVGATIGKKTVIDSAYSISPDSGGGIFTATDGNAGGIIGLARVADSSNGYKAEDDTDASTSYWVKGYTNAELAGSSVTNLQTTLGRYRLAFETYNQEGKTVTVVFTKELIGTGATTTDASTSDDTTTGGDDTDEEVAIYPTPYAYYESVGTHSVKIYDGTTVTYTASEDEANENADYVFIGENLTWQEYFDMTVGKDDNNKSKITYEEKVGAWVETVSDWKQYSTGTKATGWYFVYSKDQNGENNQIGTISAKHTVSTADGYSDLWYWKRIANAYTMSERNAGYDDDNKANSPYKTGEPLSSAIVREITKGETDDDTVSTVPQKGTLYATATAANFMTTNASGYYMYIASSGSTKPTSANYNGKFYIKAEGGISENVAVYYRSIAMGSALTYNGYERYAPISLSGDIRYDSTLSDQSAVNPDNKNSYFYNAVNKDNETPKIAKTYYTTVSVYYFDDEGKPYVVGGINEGAWRIKERSLTFSATDVTGKKYGDEDIKTTVTITDIAYNDINNIEFVLKIEGLSTPITLNLKNGAKFNENQGVTFGVVNVSSNPAIKLKGTDTKYNVGTFNSETGILTFDINFKNAKNYDLSVNLKPTELSKNYTLSNAKKQITVEKAKLEIKRVDGDPKVVFDNRTHSITWQITGFKFGETLNSIAMLSPKVFAEVDQDKTYTESLIGNTNAFVESLEIATENGNRKSNITIAVSQNDNSISLSGAKLKGTYYLAFDKQEADDCNYKLDVQESEKLIISENLLTVKWGSETGHEYNKTAGTFTAIVTAKEPIESLEVFVEEYFVITGKVKVEKYERITDDKKEVKITFKTDGYNATKYTVTLSRSNKILEVDCSFTIQDNKPSKKEYEITKRTLAFTYQMTTDNKTSFEYNSYHQGLKSVTVSNICKGDSVDLGIGGDVTVVQSGKSNGATITVSNGSNETKGAIDVGSYSAYVTIGNNTVSKNYTLPSDCTYSWDITKKSLSISGLTAQDVTYDGQEHRPNPTLNGATSQGNGVYKFGQDTIEINYKSGNELSKQSFVNAATYTISINMSQKVVAKHDGGTDASANYDPTIDGNSGTTFEIKAREITLTWTNNALVYSGPSASLGQTIATVTADDGKVFTFVSSSITNAKFKGYAGNDTITFKIGGAQANAGAWQMTASIDSVTGKNADNKTDSAKENYNIVVDESICGYNINKMKVSVKYSSGRIADKVYDATNVVKNLNGLTFAISSTNAKTTFRPKFSDVYTVSAVYTSSNVGDWQLALKYSFIGGANYEQEGELTETTSSAVGKITPATITVTLDRLRNGRATRTFAEGSSGINGIKVYYYGGADGAVNGEREANNAYKSATYRLGEGFTISGFPSAEDQKVVRVLAQYVEVGKDRELFNGYVNYIYDSGNGVYVRGTANDKYVKDNNLYKALVFSMKDVEKHSGKANNYNFKVVDTDGKTMSSTIGTSETSVTVYDSQDSKNKDRGESGQKITIEITVKTYKIKYDKTTQSYANSDGSYNKEWSPVVAIDLPNGINVDVKNGWMTENGQPDGEPKIYKQYTVIRGKVGSTELSASVTGEKGKQLNYNMTNQPVLTIGYFVEENSDTFEIGSLSSLLIASYYWWVSANSGDPEFNQVINTTVKWNALISNKDYEDGAAFAVPSGAPVPPEKADVKTWDGYFEWLETEAGGNHVVFLNETGEENERGTWGYYTTTTGAGDVKKYSSFKQIRDINGTFTQSDIEMLNGFFRVYDVDRDTYIDKEWGNGKKDAFINNFLKVGVGNVAVAIGSIFKSLENGFTGTYDGGGYVIEYFNIMSFVGDNSTENNVGMFDVLGGNATVKNLHLRNISITSDKGNVGGIAGKALTGANAIENVSWHGTISMSGDGNVGGLIGLSARSIDKAIALGTINAKGGNIGGLIGSIEKDSSSQANVGVSNAVSFVYIDATGNVGAITASSNGATATNAFYLANSAWMRSSGALAVSNGTYGAAKTYTQLIDGEAIAGVVNVGSRSGYVADTDGKKYYQGSAKGVYDVLDDFDYANQASDSIKNMNARQSLRLKDIIDVYMLMYDIKETVGTIDSTPIKVYTISSSSWLVGTGHGTDSSKIEISNRQQVALLRELRFASFILTADVVATATSVGDYAYSGAFFGSVTVESGKSYTIDFGSGKSAFEKEANENSVPYKQNTQTV